MLIGFSKTDWYVTAPRGIRNGHPLISTIKLSSALDILENFHYDMSCAAKAKSQKFTRRKLSLVKSVDQLVRLCNVDLALIIRKNGKYYTYQSTDQESWPPTTTDIAGTCGANE